MSGRPIPRRRVWQFGAVAVLVVVVAVVLGWRSGRATVTRAAAAPVAAWALPQGKSSDAEQDAAILRARRPWGGAVAFRDPETPPPAPVVISWRLVGIVLRDNSPFALILFGPPGATKLEYHTIGEALPDGSTLVQIDTDSVTAQNGPGLPAGSVVRRLFQKKS